jgi:hypothetical protein
LEIKNGNVFDAPPPGGGFTTPTCAVPADAMLLESIEADKVVLFTNAVIWLALFKVTIDWGTKLMPVTWSVKEDPPANVPDGESMVT